MSVSDVKVKIMQSIVIACSQSALLISPISLPSVFTLSFHLVYVVEVGFVAGLLTLIKQPTLCRGPQAESRMVERVQD